MTNEDLLDNLRRSYDASASERESRNPESWKIDERWRFLRFLRLEDKQRLIDVGAGTGAHAAWFQEQGIQVVCTDLSRQLVELCRAKGLEAHVADFQHLGVEPASFDAMFSMNSLLHVPRVDMQRTLTRLRAALKPGGLLYWGQYGGYEFEGTWPQDHYDPKRFFSYMTDEQIEYEATQLFELVDFRFLSLEDRGDAGYQALILRR